MPRATQTAYDSTRYVFSSRTDAARPLAEIIDMARRDGHKALLVCHFDGRPFDKIAL